MGNWNTGKCRELHHTNIPSFPIIINGEEIFVLSRIYGQTLFKKLRYER